MSEPTKCSHPTCQCAASARSDYCSAYCHVNKSQHEHSDSCGCGHKECGSPLHDMDLPRFRGRFLI
jgi:hypothetical protein